MQIRPAATLEVAPREIIVDLFAGGGGASTAIKSATGRHPDVAVNHDADAIGMHAANHPTTRHYQEDVRQVDPIQACTFDGVLRPVGVFWLSPDCTHFSKARGGKPVEKGIRSLADVLLVWIDALKPHGAHPRCIFLENVEEFQDWGPVLEDGKPCPDQKGLDFRRWVKGLLDRGYVVDWRELVAADYGDPTTRKRLKLVARNDGLPILWPERTHASRKELARMKGDLFGSALKPWRAAAEIIDFSLPCYSIFMPTAEAKKLRIKRPLGEKSEARIAKGVKRFMIDRRPVVIPITHSGPGRVHDVADPLRTITGANRGEFSLVAPTFVPRYGERAGQEPRVRDPAEPYATVVPDGNGGGLAAAFLSRQFGSTVSGRDLEAPAPTVMSDGQGGKTGVVSAHLIRMANGSIGDELSDPTKTILAHGKDGLAAVTMIQNNGDRIGREASEPLTTATHRGTQQTLMAATIDKYYGSGVTGADVEEPLDTVTDRMRFSLNAVFLEQANTDMVGHSVERPVSTIVGKGCTQRLIDVSLEEIGAPEGSTRRAVLEFLWKHFGEPTEEEWMAPTATPRARLRFGLVDIDGVVWQIVDIGMRMLTPRELFNAQGFPPDYIIDRTADGRPITKTAQTSKAGNSVCPGVAEAVLRANLTWMDLPERIAA